MRRAAVVVTSTAIALAALCAPALASTRIRRLSVARFPTVSVTIATDRTIDVSRGDVTVTENGLPVRVEDVTPVGSADSIEAVLAIDVSNSMRGSSLRTALAAAEAFVDHVPTWMRVGVVTFARKAAIVSPVTDDRTTVVTAVSRLRPTTSRGTALYDAIVTAAHMVDGGGAHDLILVTDGRNTAGANTLEQAVAAARDADMTVDAIGLKGPTTDVSTLRRLAAATGGAYATISAQDLDAVYGTLARELGHQYVVRYGSKAPGGAEADIELTTSAGTATARVLMPVIHGERAGTGPGLPWLPSTQTIQLFAVLSTFVAAVCLMAMIVGVRARAERDQVLRRRMSPAADHGAPAQSSAAIVPRPIADVAAWGADATGIGRPIHALLDRAAWDLGVGEIVGGSILVAAAGFGVTEIVVRDPLIALIVSLLALVAPFVVLSRAAARRAAGVQAQLADVLMVLGSALRAGHSFLQAIDTVSKEVDDPAASEFTRTLAEVRLGRTVEDALGSLGARMNSRDLEWAVTAINIQRKVGGNLAEVLETLAHTIRERDMLRRQMRVLSSEGRLSVAILMVLPFLLLVYMYFVNPTYLSALIGTSLGVFLMIGGGVLMSIGFVWMRRIVRLDV